MKTKNLVLHIIVMIFISEISFAQVTFQKTYGGLSLEWGYSIKQTTDGGYIIAGVTFTFDYDNGDVYLIRMDSLGNILWSKAYGDYGHEEGTSVQQTADGNFIITGYADSFTGYDTFYVIKTDSNGNELWAKSLGTGDTRSYSIQQTSDMGYIIAGNSASPDMYLMKIDSSGLLNWSKRYGGSGSDAASCVHQTTDGGYIIAGNTDSYGAGDRDVYLVKSDSAGNLTWSKTFGGGLNDYGYAVQQTTDGGYIITGATTSFGAGYYDVYLIKTDSAGDTLWTKTYGGLINDWGSSVKQAIDGGYIICGHTASFGAGDFDAYLIKTDSAGNLQWSKAFGGTDEDRALSLWQASDGGYIIAGFTESFGSGNADIYVIKTDSNGNSGCNETNAATIQFSPATLVNNVIAAAIPSSTSNYFVTSMIGSGGTATTLCTTVGISPTPALPGGEGVAIAPNPFNTTTTLTIPDHLFNYNLTLSIFSIDGRILRKQNITSPQTIIERNGLATGIYFYKISDKKVVKAVGKLMITN